MDHDRTPANLTPHLVAFEPCDGWWAVYYRPATDNRPARFVRRAVTGWGIYTEGAGRAVIAMTYDGPSLVPVTDTDDFSHLHKSGSSFCSCYDPGEDEDDYVWCSECGAEVFGRHR